MNKENSNLFKEERMARILEILEKEHRVAVPDLSLRFNVSEDTIRRDLRDLESKRLIKKIHGGALQHITSPAAYETRLQQASEQKAAIGRRAAELVEEGDSLIIDGGTTTLHMARALHLNRVRIITKSLEIATVIGQRPNYELIVLGGKWDPLHHELIGRTTVEQLLNYRVDKAFMGMVALDRKNGITDISEESAAFKRAMTQVAQQVIGLADHTKLGQVSFYCVAPPSVIDILLTDDLGDCSPFDDLGWQVIKVPGSKVELATAP